jgi:ABC-type polysaccharide/polyol phosphate transport system ATPase subunit
MSDDIAIRVRNLGKMYRIYERPSDLVAEFVTRRPRHREHWALRDLSFDIRRGQVIGVIGRNGAGKTTLLRIIADTLDKTTGTVEVNGRISAIMVLGTGFNMELSGRDNILLGGLCLGMTHGEVERKREAIVDFAGLGAYIDAPCKTYSSGMLARLAFSIAAHVDPDVLIVDEALSTGDMVFNAKSYARMRQIATSGATVLFVTHSLQYIYDLCDTAILLEGGHIAAMGSPRQVGYLYEQQIHEEMSRAHQAIQPVLEVASAPSAPAEHEPEPAREEPGTGVDEPTPAVPADTASPKVAVLGMTLLNANQSRVLEVKDDEIYTLVITVKARDAVERLSVGFDLRTLTGVQIYGASTYTLGVNVSIAAGETKDISLTFQPRLNNGSYFVSAGTAEIISDSPWTYVMLHFVADMMIIQSQTKALFPGIVNLGSAFVGERSRAQVEDETCVG